MSSPSQPTTQAASDSWAGTGGAIIGSFLSGVLAVGAAFLAAYLARRHDRHNRSHEAVSRLRVSISGFDGVLMHADEVSFPRRVVERMHAFFIEVQHEIPHIDDKKLRVMLVSWLEWFAKVWLVKFDERTSRLPDDYTDRDVRDLQRTAHAGQLALGMVDHMLTSWQLGRPMLDEFGPPEEEGGEEEEPSP